MTIIDRIVNELEIQGLKRSDLANYINKPKSQISMWEKRKTSPPAELIPAIAVFLNRSTDYILTGQDITPSEEIEFTYAAHNELAHDLSPEQIEQLKAYANLLRNQK